MMTQRQMDLRGLPVWERAVIVLEQVDELDAGGEFELKMELDPRALIGRLEELRPGELAYRPRRVGENDWQLSLTRVRVEEEASSLVRGLQRSAVFSKLSDNGRARVVESMTEHNARKGETICPENSTCSHLGIVLEGALAMFVGAGTRERMLFHFFPFDVFGDVEFFDNGLSLGRTAVISRSARYATLPYTIAHEIVSRETDFLLALSASNSQHNRALASALAAQVSKPILSRVATALLPYAVPERGLHVAMAPLPTMTQAQIAAAAGTVKEVAARAIAELERMQALRRERGHIRHLDRSKLLETIES